MSDGFLYEIAKAAGFVPSQDYTDGRFSLATKSHRGLAFSGFLLCSVNRFQRQLVLVLFTRLQRWPVLYLHEISLTVSLIWIRDRKGSQRSVAVSSFLSLDFKDVHGSQR